MILVLGGAGYIGSHVVKNLLNEGLEVLVVDNLSTGHLEAVDKRAGFVQANIGDPDLLEKLFTNYPIQVVMHFAANCLVGESVFEPLKYYENNVGNTLVLLKAMIQHGIKKFIFSSTCATYGIPNATFIDETCRTSPVNPYGYSKLMVEQMIQDYSKAYGLSYISFRYFNVAGADDSGQIGEDHDPETHLIPNILLHLLGKSKSIGVFGQDFATSDGTCVRDYIHVLDVANAHLLALKNLKNNEFITKIYNLGNNQGYSVRQVIQMCERITGKMAVVEFKDRRMGDPPCLVASSQKIQEELGWKAVYSLEDMIRSAWNWHKQNPNGF
ncbi:UDP-glucose 4-epimerase GalE [Bacillus cereus]|uniref:UDP-glucose 4-epimerase GalE n=1 Tax=Bacillus cereus TaxID=1396 RepID=UPI00356F4B68